MPSDMSQKRKSRLTGNQTATDKETKRMDHRNTLIIRPTRRYVNILEGVPT